MATYKHDALGRRVEKDLVTSRERYIYSGFETVSVYDSSDTWVRDFVFGEGIDEPLMLRQADVTDFDGDQDTSEVTRHFYHRNALGSVLLLTDMNEAEGATYRYDPYGAVTISVGGTPQSDDPLGNPWMFTSRFQDEETGLKYYRARQYAPGVGRFMQRDPLGYTRSGMYEYSDSSPAVYVDSQGLLPQAPGAKYRPDRWREGATYFVGSRMKFSQPGMKDLGRPKGKSIWIQHIASAWLYLWRTLDVAPTRTEHIQVEEYFLLASNGEMANPSGDRHKWPISERLLRDEGYCAYFLVVYGQITTGWLEGEKSDGSAFKYKSALRSVRVTAHGAASTSVSSFQMAGRAPEAGLVFHPLTPSAWYAYQDGENWCHTELEDALWASPCQRAKFEHRPPRPITPGGVELPPGGGRTWDGPPPAKPKPSGW